MARAGDPRVTLRLAAGDFAVLDGAAVSCGVETGALIREAALRSAAAVARDVAEGRVSLRRRSAAGAGEQRPAVAGPVRSASRPLALDPGVERAAMFRRALEGPRP